MEFDEDAMEPDKINDNTTVKRLVCAVDKVDKEAETFTYLSIYRRKRVNIVKQQCMKHKFKKQEPHIGGEYLKIRTKKTIIKMQSQREMINSMVS